MLQAAARIADGQVPVQRLLVVLPARPAVPARRPVAAARAVAPHRGGSCACSATPPWPCSPGRWRGAAARRSAWRSRRWLAAALAMAYPTGPHPFPLTLALALGALLLLERRPVLAGALAGPARRSGGSSSPPTWARACCSRTRCGRCRAAAAPRPLRCSPARRCWWPLVLYAPVVIAAGLGDAFDLLDPLSGRGLRATTSRCRSRSSYDGPLNTELDRRLPRATRPRACCSSTSRSC